VLWTPAFFGVKADMVIKGGSIAWAQMGDANASIPTPQPVFDRPMFGTMGMARAATCVTFVSQAALDAGRVTELLGGRRLLHAVSGCRAIGKADMVHNDATPDIVVNPETYEITADGELMTCEPATELPMAQRYFLF